ncbi:MAG: Crp/Fnr family transcriptional regulator [Acetobacteraceae bacterium]|nr:Crp/Fnr family transcriptional regulator [Acetobacteraceae bacterium]
MLRDTFAAITQLKPFAEVGEAAIAALLHGAHEEKIPAGGSVMRRGDPADSLCVLLDGRLRVSVTSAEGREHSFRLVEPPGIVGEVGVIDHGPRSADVVAAVPSRLVRIPSRACLAAIRNHSDFAEAMLRLLCERIRDTSRNSESLATEPLELRLAHLLLRLAREYGRPHGTGLLLPMRLSQGDIGTMVAATRESVNKQLRQWRGVGIIGADSGQIVLLAPAALAALLE